MKLPTTNHQPLATFRSAPRGISLIEVLISMFILLFGLMGVAAIFPVGNFYVTQGDNFDQSSSIAQNAFEELRSRGILKPEFWLYGDSVGGTNRWAMVPTGVNRGTFTEPIVGGFGPGHAFVIDPIGAASDSTLPNLDLFPQPINSAGTEVVANWWADANSRGFKFDLSGSRWPVRRITLPIPTGAMTTPVAETIFRLRDDLAVDQPKESDRPSIQRWDVDGTNLLRRQYKGDYSWLATIVPTTGAGLEALQPANSKYGQVSYDVSVVVFRKRDETPSAESERLIDAELLLGGELVIYSTTSQAKEEVDAAVDGIRPGTWISVMGVNQTTGDFVMKWYRLLSLDNETSKINVVTKNNTEQQGRRGMLIGPDWPSDSILDLRVGLFPDAISVVTKPLRMESTSMWDLE